MKKTYNAKTKQPHEIWDCEEGAMVVLAYHNEVYHGIFGHLNEDTIIIKSVGDNSITLGFPIQGLVAWLLLEENN